MTDNIKEQIEDKIIDLIALGAGGRLVVFKPEKNDKDLIIEKRNDYKNESIAINVYNTQLSDDVRIVPEDNFYLMFVNFDIVKQDIDDNFIIVPSNNLQTKLPMNKKSFIMFLMERLK